MESINIFGTDLSQFFSPEHLTMIIRVALLLFLGIPLIYFLAKWSQKYISGRFTAQQGMISAKVIKYTGLVIVFIMVLRELGFELSPLLGAAGIVGIAIGFASQTSVSNVISGLFLIAEQPFVVNDVIRVGTITGQVLSIDILSVKLRTFDNQFVRIPNETILKSEVTTITRFPIRRADLILSVAYKEDIGRVKEILKQISYDNPLCLQEPEPLIIFQGFGSSSIDLQFSVWAAKEDWLTVKNQIYEEIKKRFDSEAIEIPFPHVSLYTGSETKPLPIEVVERQKNN
jgi:small-conductance mechanosensitive channel